MRTVPLSSLFCLSLLLITCKTPPLKNIAAVNDAAQTQAIIERAQELADEYENAESKDKPAALKKYITATSRALAAAETTIAGLRERLIESEEAHARTESELSAYKTNAEKFTWLKWLLIIGGPLSLAGAFFLGRKV